MLKTVKVIILGSLNVGKIEITKKLVGNTYDRQSPYNFPYPDFSKTIEFDKYKTKIKFNIWVAAGQGTLYSEWRLFFKDTNAVIFVYDVMNKTSFEEINKWYQLFLDNCALDVILAIVGNRINRYEEIMEVSDEEAEEFARSINAIFEYVSETDTEIDLLYKIGQKYLESHCDFLDDKKVEEKENKKRSETLKGVKLSEGKKEKKGFFGFFKKDNKSNNENKDNKVKDVEKLNEKYCKAIKELEEKFETEKNRNIKLQNEINTLKK